MLPSIFGQITPYRRLCGSIFVFIAAALAPNVHYALTLALSSHAAQLSIWGMVALYLMIIAPPPLRQVTSTASIIALVVALILVATEMALERQVKQALATLIGFYGDTVPWPQAAPAEAAQAYRNPFGGYTLRIPKAWEQLPGPIEGTHEFVLRAPGNGAVAARLRPTCDLTEDPMPMTVEGMLGGTSSLKRSCDRWRGLESCLLERDADTRGSLATPLRWEWLGRDPSSKSQIRLMFEVYDERARADVLTIINSARPVEAPFEASACPNPVEWAEAFPNGAR